MRLTAINRKTGAPITGTKETIPGVCNIHNVTRNSEGKLAWENGGGTDVDWDGQRTSTDPAGQTIFVDDCGTECTEHDIEFIDRDAVEEGV